MKRKRPLQEARSKVESKIGLSHKGSARAPSFTTEENTNLKVVSTSLQHDFDYDASHGDKDLEYDEGEFNHDNVHGTGGNEDSETARIPDDEHHETDDAEIDDEPTSSRPAKRQHGRLKSYRRAPTPSPPRHLPSYHHYFFQNRPKGASSSNNSLSSLSLISHEDYFKLLDGKADHHGHERQFLQSLHSRSFDQWSFELLHGYNICLYGWGSKRAVLNAFAKFATKKSLVAQIMVVNGYNPALTPREILEAFASALPLASEIKLSRSPLDMLAAVLTSLDPKPPPKPILLLVNSIDGVSLRRQTTQSLLSRLSSSSHVQIVASTDTPHSPLIWPHGLLAQFNWIFHDCTSFQPYDVEISGGGRSSVVDEVGNLIGRSNRKLKGREGVMYVLRSLTASARNLYALLLGEILAIATNEDEDHLDFHMNSSERERTNQSQTDDDIGPPNDSEALAHPIAGSSSARIPSAIVSSHALYSRAVSQLITTNDVNYRALLKEFYDHEMITSQRDALGAEVLGVPFKKEEMEVILADLVGDV